MVPRGVSKSWALLHAFIWKQCNLSCHTNRTNFLFVVRMPSHRSMRCIIWIEYQWIDFPRGFQAENGKYYVLTAAEEEIHLWKKCTLVEERRICANRPKKADMLLTVTNFVQGCTFVLSKWKREINGWSFRQMQNRTGNRYSHSTLSATLHKACLFYQILSILYFNN